MVDEREAIIRMQQGDISGLELLVRLYQHPAKRAAYLVTRDLQRAEDIVQSGFIRAFERIQQLDPDRPFGPWFLRSVVNDATKTVVREQRQVSLDRDGRGSSIVQSFEDPRLGPDLILEGVETHEELWAALARLPASQRAAIVLRDYLGLSELETATELGTPPGTVKWRLHAARQRLRQMLRPQSATDTPSSLEK